MQDAKRAFKKMHASCLFWMTGRHFTREENGEENAGEALQVARLWDFDTVNIPGREMDPLVCKVKVQKLMSQHLADYIMTRRMNNGSTALRDTLSGRPLEFLQHIRPYPLRRRNVVMTSLAAGAGGARHCRTGHSSQEQ